MKVLIFGPSASGKTYVSHALQRCGILAFDSDDLEGLSAWYDKSGRKVATPQTADEAFQNHYSFLWSRRYLANFLNRYADVYLFGGAGNVFNMLDLFDKAYFLKVDPSLQKERLLNASRKRPMMDANEKGLVTWGDWMETEAKNRNLPFIDGSLTPKEILTVIQHQ